MPRKNKEIDFLMRYYELGFGLVVTIALSVLKFPRLLVLFQTDIPHALCSFTLFLVTCAWFIGWLYFDHEELQLIDVYIDIPNTKKIRTDPFISMLGIGFLAGFLLGLSDQPRFYILLAIVIWIFGAVGQKTVFKYLNSLYTHFDKYKIGVRQHICDYYLKRPFLKLDLITFAFLFIALALAWYASFTGDRPSLFVSYSITIIMVVAHEAIIWSWRRHRDKFIDIIEQEEEFKRLKKE